METSIEQVIERLTEIVENAKEDGSRMGYFAALYRKVTVAVKQKIDGHSQEPYFDDPQRMEEFDVAFASRYLDEYDAYAIGDAPVASWEYAFNATQQYWPIVLQHLLLGMNAHINLDLGIAAARIAPGDKLPDLKDDFDRINQLLASLVDEVRQDLAWIWPPLRILNRYLSGEQDVIINFSMEVARDQAWRVATRLAPLSVAEQEPLIEELDTEVAELARLIRHPGIVASWVARAIRLGETKSVPRVIAILE